MGVMLCENYTVCGNLISTRSIPVQVTYNYVMFNTTLSSFPVERFQTKKINGAKTAKEVQVGMNPPLAGKGLLFDR